jgi:hypothetical protein
MIMNGVTLRGALAVGALSLAAAASAPAAPATAATPAYSETYADPTGDSNTSPDITAVTVSNDAAGMLTFTVAIGNRPALVPGDVITLTIDADHNESSGSPTGLDVMVMLMSMPDGSMKVVGGRWTGSEDFTPLPSSAFNAAYSNGTATVSVPGTTIGAGPKLEFGVFTLDAASSAASSFTGDLAGTYTYLVGGPNGAPKPTLGSFPRIAPHQGKRFSVLASTTSGGRPIDGTEVSGTCRAKVGGKSIPAKAVWQELGSHSAAYRTLTGCDIRVPKRSAGKRLTGSIQVTYLSKTTTRTFSYRIQK